MLWPYPIMAQFEDAYQGYPAKRALSAMRKHGGWGPFVRIPSIYESIILGVLHNQLIKYYRILASTHRFGQRILQWSVLFLYVSILLNICLFVSLPMCSSVSMLLRYNPQYFMYLFHIIMLSLSLHVWFTGTGLVVQLSLRQWNDSWVVLVSLIRMNPQETQTVWIICIILWM